MTVVGSAQLWMFSSLCSRWGWEIYLNAILICGGEISCALAERRRVHQGDGGGGILWWFNFGFAGGGHVVETLLGVVGGGLAGVGLEGFERGKTGEPFPAGDGDDVGDDLVGEQSLVEIDGIAAGLDRATGGADNFLQQAGEFIGIGTGLDVFQQGDFGVGHFAEEVGERDGAPGHVEFRVFGFEFRVS